MSPLPDSTPEIDQVLHFWLGASQADGSLDPAKRKMWFGDGSRYDAEIGARFGTLHERAARGDLESEWAARARGRLALIVVLDQFSRHIYRGAPDAFAQDAMAQRLAAEGERRGMDRELIPAARAFFYLPFEHAEDLEMQQLAVRCFERLAAEVAAQWRKDYESYLDYAVRHCRIVERFGRFPHRNAVLGRPSTAEEIEFLKEPGSGF